MKMFWKIEGTDKPLYTAKAYIKYIINKKTRKKYYCGEGKFYKKKNYPKNLAEDQWDIIKKKSQCIYDFYYETIPPTRIEKMGLFKARSISPAKPYEREKEYMNSFALWKIDGLVPTMYTWKKVDLIRDKRTGKEYKRGELVRFHNEDETPFPLVEYTDDFEYILIVEQGNNCIELKDYAREMWVNSLFRK